jgi:DNA-binding PadR family transcriptional regulator
MATKGLLTVTGEMRETGLGGKAEVYAITGKGIQRLGEL